MSSLRWRRWVSNCFFVVDGGVVAPSEWGIFSPLLILYSICVYMCIVNFAKPMSWELTRQPTRL